MPRPKIILRPRDESPNNMRWQNLATNETISLGTKNDFGFPNVY